jgi:hypothetical protein
LKRALAALLLAASCAEPPRASPPTAETRAEGPAFTLRDRDIHAVIQLVGVARQLPPKKPIDVVRLDRARFVERLLAGRGARERSSGALTPEAAFLLGFDFLPDPSRRREIATVQEVLKEQVVGFYDRSEDRVFIPDVRLRSASDLLEQRGVLAHEAHHALQAQHFARAPKPRSSDEAIAQLALIEGDAMVAMGAWLGAEAGAPVGRTLRRIIDVTKRVPLATITRGDERKKLDEALDLTRKQLELPYREGMMLVSDVYRAGGFPLVDRMYQSYPVSTEQVIHPEKYLAGELPRPVADPEPPAGYTPSVFDTLGELDTRTLFERCLDAPAAARAASGWGGDRYGVFASPEGRLATAWISAWDTVRDAEEVEDALTKPCFHDNSLGSQGRTYTIRADIHVRRQGKLIAFLRGYPRGSEERAAHDLLAKVGPEPAPRPITDQKIPPRVALPEPHPGQIQGDVYRNDWIGVVGRVPPGMAGRIGAGIDFVVERRDVLVRGGLSISTRITNDEQNEKTFREVQDSFVEEVSKHAMQVERLGGGPSQTALGAAVERTWRIAGTMIELRLVLVPICAGTGSIVFVQVYGDPYGRTVLDGWMGSFRWIQGRNIRACDFLDPK